MKRLLLEVGIVAVLVGCSHPAADLEGMTSGSGTTSGTSTGTTTGSSTTGTTTGTATGGCPTLAQGCDPADQAWILATDAGIDCGEIHVSDLFPTDAGAAASSSDCALGAQDAGQSFVLLITSSGVDTANETAYVRTPDGQSYFLTQFLSNCQPAELDRSTCGSFAPATVPVPFSDGGVPGIACDGQGAPVCLCFGKAC
jgi:hypothetical protein